MGQMTIYRHSERHMRSGVQLLLAGLFAVQGVQAGAQSKTCHAADSESAKVIRAVNALMKPESAALRTRFAVPFASPSQIVLVSDSTICAKAGEALDSLARNWAPSQPQPPANSNPLYVVQVGSYFAVVDENGPPPDQSQFIFYFSPLWEFRTMFTF
jgi:hypothetical protein